MPTLFKQKGRPAEVHQPPRRQPPGGWLSYFYEGQSLFIKLSIFLWTSPIFKSSLSSILTMAASNFFIDVNLDENIPIVKNITARVVIKVGIAHNGTVIMKKSF